MEKKTLVLTPWMFPKQIISWEDAVKLKYEKNVDVLAEYAETVSSPSVTWKIPAVVRLRKLPKHEPGVRYSRRAVFIRDGFRCQYCGNPFPESKLTRDHVHPRARGGLTNWTNTVAACRGCQDKKKDRTCDELGMFPINWPKKPSHVKLVPPRMPVEIPEEWEPYVLDVG